MNACAGSGALKPETPPWPDAGIDAEIDPAIDAAGPLQDALRLSLAQHSAARVWIAFSGGRDSRALLHAAVQLVNSLPQALRPQLGAVHIDHGIHPNSADWAEHCRACCAALAVPIRVQTVAAAPQPGQSPEEAAREARWAVWQQLLAPGEQLWIAQHQDDQAETLLLALLRGAGVKGLAAIPRNRVLGAGQAVRPWLHCTGAQIAAYASAHGLEWIEDPSNQNTALDRNYLRQRILPLLRERWPAASATLARAAAHCGEAAKLLETAGADWLANAAGSAPERLSVSGLLSMPRDRRHAVLRHWLAQRGFRMPNHRRLEQISQSLLAARADASPLVAWSGCELRRYRDDLFALEPLPPAPVASMDWPAGQPLHLGGRLGELSRPASHAASMLDAGALQVRFGLTGLRCRPRPDGPNRHLKALFQQQGVPAWLRPYVPLVFAGEQLVAVAGVALCDGRLTALCWRHALGVTAGLTEILGDAESLAPEAEMSLPGAGSGTQ
ncbi:tRNA lysidine(34) synthetase TilS [Thiorhodovibrio frisius]|uniref:tRNA(Ile)-lysidine synthase n=1 Tax=Thiorhodovibrio frisius TaxID=631362 RepID=H8Z2V8_9GAMM|nr:tRNA lysidine(34) synthetase TilS [Thiorhodovibrio frisius]EIC21694.1 tRNA(Ile)-lysidine synthetase [Thiorhodovibrio frisius]WPL21662.1 tRNA(Ile)-lysidine synthase [Thiorhodovibrio frisius]